MELKKFITEAEYQQLLHFEYKDIWKQCMEDLFYSTHCHSCGCDITPHSSTYQAHCSKACWRGWSYYDNEENCAFGENCKKCNNEKYNPSLANSANMCYYYGLNPMGRGTKYCKYGIGIDKAYSTH